MNKKNKTTKIIKTIRVKMRSKSLGKRGMMDDLFDFFFTLAASIFLLMFIGAALRGGIESSKQQSLQEVADFKQISSSINNLQLLLYQGNNLEAVNIEELISNSEEWQGSIITTCQDYAVEQDCLADPLEISEEECDWKNDRCVFG